MPSKPGRKPTMDDTRKAAYLTALRDGLSDVCARALVGVSRPAVYRAGKADPAFARDREKAVVQGKYTLLKRIWAAASGTGAGQWVAAAWLLERKWYQEFGRRRPDAYGHAQFIAFAVALAEIARRMIAPERHEEYNQAVENLLAKMESGAR